MIINFILMKNLTILSILALALTLQVNGTITGLYYNNCTNDTDNGTCLGDQYNYFIAQYDYSVDAYVGNLWLIVFGNDSNYSYTAFPLILSTKTAFKRVGFLNWTMAIDMRNATLEPFAGREVYFWG